MQNSSLLICTVFLLPELLGDLCDHCRDPVPDGLTGEHRQLQVLITPDVREAAWYLHHHSHSLCLLGVILPAFVQEEIQPLGQ